MTERKETQKYVFSVEGDTEKWYLEWLRDQINSTGKAKYNVLISATVQKNPLKFAKRLTSNTTPNVIHLCDVEGETPAERKEFQNVLALMKEAMKAKKIRYDLGYSNLSFELWMILHKEDCRAPLSTKKQYLSRIIAKRAACCDTLELRFQHGITKNVPQNTANAGFSFSAVSD